MPLKAILFDFDGTLAETAHAHIEAWHRTFEEAGLKVSLAECGPSAEVEDYRFASEVLKRHGPTDHDIDALVRRKFTIGLECLAQTARLYPGTDEFIRDLVGCYALAVISSTWHENIEAVLGRAGLMKSFPVVVGKVDLVTNRRKPLPDAYLLGARRLGIAPGDCLAVEDALEGIRSAHAAGMRCLAVAHRHPPRDLAEADWVISDFLNRTAIDQILAIAAR